MYGVGNECYFWQTTTAISGTGSGESDPISAMARNEVTGLQLIVEPVTRVVVHNAADSVVASSGNWLFTNGAFTSADIGGTITVAGASHSGNNGTFTILTVPSATHITTATTGLVNETFGSGVTMTVTSPLLNGDWAVEISNDYTPASSTGDFGQEPNIDGHWTDITSAFAPAIETVISSDAGTYSQYVQALICVRAIKFTFTATSGFGYPLILGQMRSYFGG